MKILIDVDDSFIPAEGDAFDAVQSALQHFDIPAQLTGQKPEKKARGKFFKGTIKECLGEKEFLNVFIVKAKTEASAIKKLRKVARYFWDDDGGEWDKAAGCFCFDGGEVAVSFYINEETTKEEFLSLTLKNHLVQ
jgi:hypothetical protein